MLHKIVVENLLGVCRGLKKARMDLGCGFESRSRCLTQLSQFSRAHVFAQTEWLFHVVIELTGGLALKRQDLLHLLHHLLAVLQLIVMNLHTDNMPDASSQATSAHRQHAWCLISSLISSYICTTCLMPHLKLHLHTDNMPDASSQATSARRSSDSSP